MKKFDNGFEISATTESPIAFFLVPFMLVWSGGSLGGIYGTQIANGHFNLFLSLFGIPFCNGDNIIWFNSYNGSSWKDFNKNKR